MSFTLKSLKIALVSTALSLTAANAWAQSEDHNSTRSNKGSVASPADGETGFLTDQEGVKDFANPSSEEPIKRKTFIKEILKDGTDGKVSEGGDESELDKPTEKAADKIGGVVGESQRASSSGYLKFDGVDGETQRANSSSNAKFDGVDGETLQAGPSGDAKFDGETLQAGPSGDAKFDGVDGESEGPRAPTATDYNSSRSNKADGNAAAIPDTDGEDEGSDESRSTTGED